MFSLCTVSELAKNAKGDDIWLLKANFSLFSLIYNSILSFIIEVDTVDLC